MKCPHAVQFKVQWTPIDDLSLLLVYLSTFLMSLSFYSSLLVLPVSNNRITCPFNFSVCLFGFLSILPVHRNRITDNIQTELDVQYQEQQTPMVIGHLSLLLDSLSICLCLSLYLLLLVLPVSNNRLTCHFYFSVSFLFSFSYLSSSSSYFRPYLREAAKKRFSHWHFFTYKPCFPPQDYRIL